MSKHLLCFFRGNSLLKTSMPKPRSIFYGLLLLIFSLRLFFPSLEIYPRDYIDAVFFHFAGKHLEGRSKEIQKSPPHGALLRFDAETARTLGRSYLKEEEARELISDLKKITSESLIVDTNYLETEALNGSSQLDNLDLPAPQSGLAVITVHQNKNTLNAYARSASLTEPGQKLSGLIRKPYEKNQWKAFISRLPFQAFDPNFYSGLTSYLPPTIEKGQILAAYEENTAFSFAAGRWANAEKTRVLLSPWLAALGEIKIYPNFIQRGDRILELDHAGRLLIPFLDAVYIQSKLEKSVAPYFKAGLREGFLQSLKGLNYVYLDLSSLVYSRTNKFAPDGYGDNIQQSLSFLEVFYKDRLAIPLRFPRLILILATALALTLALSLPPLVLGLSIAGLGVLWTGLALYFWLKLGFVFPVLEPLLTLTLASMGFHQLKPSFLKYFVHELKNNEFIEKDFIYLRLFQPSLTSFYPASAALKQRKAYFKQFKGKNMSAGQGLLTRILYVDLPKNKLEKLEHALSRFEALIREMILKEFSRAQKAASTLPLMPLYFEIGHSERIQDLLRHSDSLPEETLLEHLAPFSLTLEIDTPLADYFISQKKWQIAYQDGGGLLSAIPPELSPQVFVYAKEFIEKSLRKSQAQRDNSAARVN